MTDPSTAPEATLATTPERRAEPEAVPLPAQPDMTVTAVTPSLEAPDAPGLSKEGTAATAHGGEVAPPAALAPSAAPTRASTDAPASARAGRRKRRGRTIRRRVAVVLLVLALGAASAASVHLYRTTRAWQDRADDYLVASVGLGEELASSRAELAGSQAELDAVRAQLATAQARIVVLADEKAQLGDDREVQQQVVDYQERVTEAAGRVALALDQCVQGQNQLIGYLQHADQYDPAEIERYGTDVQALCQTATDANIALQRELDR